MRTQFYILLALLAAQIARGANPYYRIEVVDEQTGRGVPLVELRTNNSISHWTDSNGFVAFNEPGMVDGAEVWFHVQSDGYSFPKDGLGNTGARLRPKAGGSAKIKMKRENIAERLYRVTGQGIYRDSILLGEKTPLAKPVLNGQVLGQDTVITALYRGKIFWFWGDTDRLSYPLGNFSATGATSEPPGSGGLDPSRGVNLTYFTGKDGFAAPMCPNFGPGLQWIESLFTLRDPGGRERLVARVSSQKGVEPAYAWHFAAWNDAKNHFESVVKWDVQSGHDSSHPFRAKVNGTNYLYLYPNYRVVEDWHAVTNLAGYEAFTCMAEEKPDRDSAGKLRWNWRAGAKRLQIGAQREHIKAGHYTRDEGWMRVSDVETQKPVDLNRGSVCWSDFRKTWIMIGSAGPGEIYYSEATSPTGPWEHARKIVTHKAYNFYNPTQHAWADDGKFIYFEGTYTSAFSAAKERTPRYDYNQIMYRLDLSDPRLKMPAARSAPFEQSGATKPL